MYLLDFKRQRHTMKLNASIPMRHAPYPLYPIKSKAASPNIPANGAYPNPRDSMGSAAINKFCIIFMGLSYV